MSEDSIRETMRLPPGHGAAPPAADDPEPDAAPAGSYVPNEVSFEKRYFTAILALAILAYAAVGVVVDDIYIPGRRSNGLHVHGPAIWVVLVAAIALAASALTIVVDHYDRRDNEARYRQLRLLLFRVAIGLIVLAGVLDLVVFHDFSD